MLFDNVEIIVHNTSNLDRIDKVTLVSCSDFHAVIIIRTEIAGWLEMGPVSDFYQVKLLISDTSGTISLAHLDIKNLPNDIYTMGCRVANGFEVCFYLVNKDKSI